VDIFLESQGVGCTYSGTSRIALAEVALDGLSRVTIRDHGRKWAHNGAHLTSQASILVHLIGSGLMVQLNGTHRTDTGTWSILTLHADNGNRKASILPRAQLNTRIIGAEFPKFAERTGQFALVAACAPIAINDECFRHLL
jgi:hypothetical protein